MAHSKSRLRVVLAVLAGAGLATGYSTPAGAIGCFTGGLAGAVAGHMVHHGVLGAFGGCVAGHQINKRQKLQDTRDWNTSRSGNGDGRSPGYGGSQPARGPYHGSD